jgi:hypothetical protein
MASGDRFIAGGPIGDSRLPRPGAMRSTAPSRPQKLEQLEKLGKQESRKARLDSATPAEFS